MLHTFVMALHVCFKSMFHLFPLYVINVSSVCFKSRSGVVHIAMRIGGWRLADSGLPQPLGAAVGAPPWFTCGRGMGVASLVRLSGH
jgi:hypothetical protein